MNSKRPTKPGPFRASVHPSAPPGHQSPQNSEGQDISAKGSQQLTIRNIQPQALLRHLLALLLHLLALLAVSSGDGGVSPSPCSLVSLTNTQWISLMKWPDSLMSTSCCPTLKQGQESWFRGRPSHVLSWWTDLQTW